MKMMQSREVNIPRGVEPWDDGYPLWLAAWLIRRAADGTLFVKHDGELSLWMPMIGGDAVFWQIARVTRIHGSGEKCVVGGPWQIWRYYGHMVTPNLDEPPGAYAQVHYPLAGVSQGDLAELEIYRVSMVSFRSIDDKDLSRLIEDDSARLVLRLQVPVVVNP
ncbi:MAG: hypothetical protein JJU33_11755 [Phycisphaerales bacterium]|nr:hypothetical protein [Phycisphaerales bacterium]